MHTNEPDTGGGFEAITTLEDLGRYLQGLRGKWRVTQESLSTKTGAITERKISRSRISEIENAKRDRVTERELRVYMRGLKCTPRHIDQVVKVLTQCTAPPAKESPAGLGGAEDDLAPLEEKSDDDPVGAGQEKEGRDRWPQVKTCITPRAASLPQLSRCRSQRHCICITLVAATALVVVALGGLGIEFSLRGESRDRPTPPGSPTALLVPHSAPLVAEDTFDLIKDATSPAGTPVRANQRFTKVDEVGNRLADRVDAAVRNATQQFHREAEHEWTKERCERSLESRFHTQRVEATRKGVGGVRDTRAGEDTDEPQDQPGGQSEDYPVGPPRGAIKGWC